MGSGDTKKLSLLSLISSLWLYFIFCRAWTVVEMNTAGRSHISNTPNIQRWAYHSSSEFTHCDPLRFPWLLMQRNAIPESGVINHSLVSATIVLYLLAEIHCELYTLTRVLINVPASKSMWTAFDRNAVPWNYRDFPVLMLWIWAALVISIL